VIWTIRHAVDDVDRSPLVSRPLVTRSGAQVLGRVWQERDVTRALERDRELALVTGTRPGLPTGFDLGPFGQVSTEAVDLLVVDERGLVRAEGADLAASAISVEIVALAGSGGRHGRMVS
jgi:hypothetical protein